MSRYIAVLCSLAFCGCSSADSGASDANSDAGSSAAYGGQCKPDLACRLDALASTGDAHQDCVDRINQFRTRCACLAPLERWRDGEACADQMAEHDRSVSGAHDGFVKRLCTPSGNAQNECPSYSGPTDVIAQCLQLMWSEGPAPGASCDGSCFQQHGHFINMTDPKYKRVACGFSALTQPKVWSVQNYSP